MHYFKNFYPYVYEFLKDNIIDFVKLIADLTFLFEEKNNKIYLDKKNTCYFKNNKNIVTLFESIGIFQNSKIVIYLIMILYLVNMFIE